MPKTRPPSTLYMRYGCLFSNRMFPVTLCTRFSGDLRLAMTICTDGVTDRLTT